MARPRRSKWNWSAISATIQAENTPPASPASRRATAMRLNVCAIAAKMAASAKMAAAARMNRIRPYRSESGPMTRAEMAAAMAYSVTSEPAVAMCTENVFSKAGNSTGITWTSVRPRKNRPSSHAKSPGRHPACCCRLRGSKPSEVMASFRHRHHRPPRSDRHDPTTTQSGCLPDWQYPYDRRWSPH